MLRLTCPTGCPGSIRRPYSRRTEPVQCSNCRAWLAASERAEDGGLAEAVLLAAPGGAVARPPRISVGWLAWLAGFAERAFGAERASAVRASAARASTKTR